LRPRSRRLLMCIQTAAHGGGWSRSHQGDEDRRGAWAIDLDVEWSGRQTAGGLDFGAWVDCNSANETSGLVM